MACELPCYTEPCVEDSSGIPASLPDSTSLDAFEAYSFTAASTYGCAPYTCESTFVLGSFIGDSRETPLRLLSKLHGMTKKLLTLL